MTDPTPRQIRQRAAAIRKEWTPKQWEQRAGIFRFQRRRRKRAIRIIKLHAPLQPDATAEDLIRELIEC